MEKNEVIIMLATLSSLLKKGYFIDAHIIIEMHLKRLRASKIKTSGC